MNRDQMLNKVREFSGYWDVIVIGGGATGLGAAVESAARGYKTVLFEQSDFARATSSRSTKLIHGGIRYLQQGNFNLVLEALRERGLLIGNAPHLVHHQSFIVPTYDWWQGPFYGVGMKVYDKLAGKLGLGPSRRLSKEETLKHIPNLEANGLKGGIHYYDGQFDDARLAISLTQTLADMDGIPLNYARVTGLQKTNNMVDGVTVKDEESGEEFEVNAHSVVNATGIFTDEILRMDEEHNPGIMTWSQGVHLVLERDFLAGDTAIMVPKTEDGRVLFAVPWHNRVIVGTTDTPVDKPELEPRPFDEEVEYILNHASFFMDRNPTRQDVKSVFAGLRPLVRPLENKKTSSISRDHTVVVSRSGLVTIAGGKWTTYRKMGQDVIDKAAMVAGLDIRESKTHNLHLHGWLNKSDRSDMMYVYGADIVGIKKLMDQHPEFNQPLHPDLPYQKAEVVWAVRKEMARTVDDVLSRRTRALLLDARAAIEAAPETARLMATELGADETWEHTQVHQFEKIAEGYLLK